MGYHTTFEGCFTVTPLLKPSHTAYLRAFSETRRMKRNEFKTDQMPDPLRKAVGLPVGEDGEYFVGAYNDRQCGQSQTPDIVDYNEPPAKQPGLWCQWIPNEDGSRIEWDGGEKFYDYDEWLQYLIVHFLSPWGYKISGTVLYQGEDPADFGRVAVEDGDTVVKTPGKRVY